MTGLASALLLIAAFQSAPVIDVVYPRPVLNDPMPYIANVDSNFVFGSVDPPDARLWIDGQEVSLYPNGAFLAYLPVNWIKKSYSLFAISEEDSTEAELPFSTRPASATKPLTPQDVPKTLELSGQPLRTDPKGTYFMFPLPGTRVVASEWKAGYFRIPLTRDRSAWVEARTVRDISDANESYPTAIWKIDLDTLDEGVSLFIPVDRKLLFRVVDEFAPDKVVMEIFGAVSHIDRISFPTETGFVRDVNWEQTADNCIRITIKLSESLWGYSVSWEETGLRLRLRPPPAAKRMLQGIRIAVDPGHGGSQDGSIGPTRLLEKNVNLDCAMALVKRLTKSGATVLLTLDKDSTMSLPDRTNLAAEFDADILISLHHNALPDGVNPFGDYGTGTHYYRPQSRDLALAVQASVVALLGLPNEGVYYDDLALVRPTAQPAILLEAAYMMLPEQELLLRDEDYPDRLAKAVEKGISKFVHDRLSKKNRN